MPSWRDVLKIQPAAEMFALMSRKDLKALGEDIKEHVLRSPVVLLGQKLSEKRSRTLAEQIANYDAVLLDGRNRLDAIELVGIEDDIDSETIVDGPYCSPEMG